MRHIWKRRMYERGLPHRLQRLRCRIANFGVLRTAAFHAFVAIVVLPQSRRNGMPSAARRLRASSSVFAVLQKTVEAGTREIQMVAAQESIANPPMSFPVRRLR